MSAPDEVNIYAQVLKTKAFIGTRWLRSIAHPAANDVRPPARDEYADGDIDHPRDPFPHAFSGFPYAGERPSFALWLKWAGNEARRGGEASFHSTTPTDGAAQ